MPCQPDALLSWATLQRKIASLELAIQMVTPEREWILAILMLPWMRVCLRELWAQRLKRIGLMLDWRTRLTLTLMPLAP